MDAEAAPVEGTWWRQIPGGGDVHYSPPDPANSRWQRGAVIDALYFAESEQTAWAEWYRYLAEAGIPPMAALPRDLWRWDLELECVADLSDEDKLRRVGLPLPKPGRWSWPNFQAVGEALYSDGFTGLLAPSAARPIGQVLCVFRETIIVPGTTPIPPPVHHEFPPLVPTGMTT